MLDPFRVRIAPVSFRLALTAGGGTVSFGFLGSNQGEIGFFVSFSLREDSASRVVDILGGVATRFPAGHWGLPPGWILGLTC